MKNIPLLALSCAFALLASMSAAVEYIQTFAHTEGWVKAPEKPWRQDLCLNGSWQFQPVALPENFAEGKNAVPREMTPPIADAWEKTPIRIPSPWNVNSFADKNGLGGDFRCYPSYPKEWEKVEMGWLRRSFTVPADWKGKRLILHFQAAAGEVQVFVNGKPVGRHFGIFLPFEFDVTDAVHFGGTNEILVGIRKASLFDRKGAYGRRTYQAGSFWGQHIVGIWNDLFLLAVSQARISDVFVKPMVDADTLEAEVTLHNDGEKETNLKIAGSVFPWIPGEAKDGMAAVIPESKLGETAVLEMPSISVKVPAHGDSKVSLSVPVKGRLNYWTPDSPNLYGLVVKASEGGAIKDSSYTRFGWRQISLKGNSVLLNGQPLVMKGDSWHFCGIPQMTRRYPLAWFKMLHDAGLNAVRLHAQPYPKFYLDVADEMGILVLDESAMWASDSGAKLDDPAYWGDSEEHLKELVQRDRNHPCVFGWSVSNEIWPIVHNVLHNPPGMAKELDRHYEIWADICRTNDPTRQWISADGEKDGDGKLPTFVDHYGGLGAIEKGEQSGKPFGIGETGSAYFATPLQMSKFNGDRAYESYRGKMEGAAFEAYALLCQMREHHASYRSVFNLVWYGLEQLPLGMKDTSKPPTLQDGVFFTHFAENEPGVQPERLGPYCTTLNPGYDPALPLYIPWPLFEAIHEASAEPPIAGKWSVSPATNLPAASHPAVAKVSGISLLAASGSPLASRLKNLGVKLDASGQAGSPGLLIIDGAMPPTGAAEEMKATLDQGGTVLVWGADPATLSVLNTLLPAPLELSHREASSLLPANTASASSPLLAGMTPASLYFSEQKPSTITEIGLGGPLIAQSTPLLKACDTDWLKWNKQPEYAKTAMVIRSEREAKPSGVVLAEKECGKGRLLITTLPSAPKLVKSEQLIQLFLSNLGVPLAAVNDTGKPLRKNGNLVHALVTGFYPAPSVKEAAATNTVLPSSGATIRSGAEAAGRKWKAVAFGEGGLDVAKIGLGESQPNSFCYLSFWVQSPKSLVDLLLEPDLPTVKLETTQDEGGCQVWLNGQSILESFKKGSEESAPLKLQQGWNHFLIKVISSNGGTTFQAKLTSSSDDFLPQLDSALEKP
jgi:beta-galactosidase